MAATDFDGVYQKFVLDPIQYVRSLDEDDYTYTIQDISIPQAAYTTYQENHYYFNIVFGLGNLLHLPPQMPRRRQLVDGSFGGVEEDDHQQYHNNSYYIDIGLDQHPKVVVLDDFKLAFR